MSPRLRPVNRDPSVPSKALCLTQPEPGLGPGQQLLVLWVCGLGAQRLSDLVCLTFLLQPSLTAQVKLHAAGLGAQASHIALQLDV